MINTINLAKYSVISIFKKNKLIKQTNPYKSHPHQVKSEYGIKCAGALKGIHALRST